MSIVITTSTVNTFVNTGFGTGSFSSSGVLGGTNFPAGSKAIVVVLNSGNTAGTNWKLGGNAMSVAVQSTDSNCTQYYVDLTASTSDTVSFNGGNNTSFYLITCWYLTGASSGAPSATATVAFGANQQVNSTTLTTPSSGIQTSVDYCEQAGNPPSTVFTWTNATQNFLNQSASASTPLAMAGATESSASGSITITASGTGPSGSNFNYGMNTAAWGPSTAAAVPPQDIIYGAEVDTIHSYTRVYEIVGY